jgi:Type I phosphodiesterase / nucleotide pyrophosphatase
MRRFQFQPLAIVALVTAVLLCAPPAFARNVQELRERRPIRDVYVIHFVLDGTNRKAFEEALRQGRLPMVEKGFVHGGATFTHALSTFPSTSTTAYQSFVAGLLPGHSGIPHLERFDRERGQVIDYLTAGGYRQLNDDFLNLRALMDPAVAALDPPSTIFELLAGYPTAAVYSSFSRGAAKTFPAIAPFHALWDTYVNDRIEGVDLLAMRRVEALFQAPIEEIPRYTLVGLYSSDLMGHRYGPQSEEVLDILEQFDHFLRDVQGLLEARGLAQKTYIIISADHGMHETGQLFRLREALEEEGIAVKPHEPRDKDFTVYAANRGVASSHLYVRHDGGFAPLADPEIIRHVPAAHSKEVDLIEGIRSLDATDLVVVRAGERRVRVYGHDGGEAEIACFTVDLVDYCSYRLLGRARDPLDLAAEPKLARLLDGRPHSTFAWREASADAQYPDAVIGLSQIFQDGRAGDVFVTARGRYGFRKVKEGNHGGPTAEDMRVPLLIAGPSIAPGSHGVARSVDLYPLVLEWFGIEVPASDHDGVNPLRPSPREDRAGALLATLEQALEGTPPLLKMIDAEGFVRKEILPLVPPKERAALRARAAREVHLRSELVRRLAEREQGEGDPRSAADHRALVQRTRAWAEARLARMEEIEVILAGCAGDAATCSGRR